MVDRVGVLSRPCARWARALLFSAGTAAIGCVRADSLQARCDIYPKGASKPAAVLACSYSQRQGFVGIDRADGVRHDLRPRDAPGSYVDDKGRPVVRVRGLGNRGTIYRFERETIYVYWSTAGLPRAASAPARADAPRLTPAPQAVKPEVPFDRTLKWQGVSFRVVCPNQGAANRLEIAPQGLTIDNTVVAHDIDGVVTGAEVADLDIDGSPEVYVYVAAVGGDARGSLVAYGANRGKSMSQIALPEIGNDARAAAGYRGHDAFAVVENRLVRRFPVYRDGDAPDAPSGGMRQLQYRLVRGEATWQLRVDRIVSY